MIPEIPQHVAPPRSKRNENTGLILAAGGLIIGIGIGVLTAFRPADSVENKAATEKTNVAVRPETKPVLTSVPPPAPVKIEPQKITDPKTTEPKPPESKPIDPKPVEAKTVESKPVETKTAPTTVPPATTESIDPREQFAARRWTELRTKAPNVSDLAYWQSVNTFAKTYATTKAGTEASEWLLKNPPPPPPPPPMPANQPQVGGGVQLALTFEDEAEVKYVKDSANERAEGFGGKGRGLKSRLLENKQLVRATTLVVEFPDKAVPVSAGTWIRFAYKGQGLLNIRTVVNIEGHQSAAFKMAEEGKWTWLTLKMTDFTGDGSPLKLPRADMKIRGLIIDGGRKAGDPTFLIDNIMIGDGPIPDPPKE